MVFASGEFEKFFMDIFSSIIRGITEDMINGMIGGMLELINDTIQNTNSLVALERSLFGGSAVFQNLFYYSKIAASILVTILLIIRILNALKQNLTGEETPNFAEIIGSFIVSYALIFAIPWIIQEFLMSINGNIITLLQDKNLGFHIMLDPNAKIADFFLIPHLNFFVTLFYFWLLFIAFILFAIAGAIRTIELFIIILIGPLVATTFTNRSEMMRTYWTECIAVVFTQSIQYFLLLLMLHCLQGGKIMFAIATVAVAIKGPQVLRQYMHNTGATSIAGSPIKVAAMSHFLMRNVGR